MNLKNLKQERERRRLTQADVAESVGVHVNTYILWEKQCGKPRAKNLKKLKKLFAETPVKYKKNSQLPEKRNKVTPRVNRPKSKLDEIFG